MSGQPRNCETRTLIDISYRIPQTMVDLLQAVDDAAQKGGIPFFVVGAAARDMILRYGYGFPVRRRTLDVDIAVRVADWKEYNSLVGTLIASGEFDPTEIGHRFLFRATEIIDVVPFGPIAGQNKSIAWPPTEETVMRVTGFEESFRSAMMVTVRQDPHLELHVCTLAGLALMKLISWNESYPSRSADAEDFYYITENYIDAGNEERLHADAVDLLEVKSFDLGVAGAQLLGRDMAGLADDSRGLVGTILESESDPLGSLRLISDIVRVSMSMQKKSDEVLELITRVREGFSEPMKNRRNS